MEMCINLAWIDNVIYAAGLFFLIAVPIVWLKDRLTPPTRRS